MISYIKALARNLKVEYISQKQRHIRIQLKDDEKLKPENILKVLEAYPRQVTINAGQQPYFLYKILTQDQNKMLIELGNLIEKISGLKS